MNISDKLITLNNVKQDIKSAIEEKGRNLTEVPFTSYGDEIRQIEIGTGSPPPITNDGIFTGATIPLTYKDNTHTYENVYEYKSQYTITIAGLTNATITNNGTNHVTVTFDVTSATSSLEEFTITLNINETNVIYKGLHAHYGVTVTGILALVYTVMPRVGLGEIGTNYLFIESSANDLPFFGFYSWNNIYHHQVLNVLIGNCSITDFNDNFLGDCYSFNQPLVIPDGVTNLGHSFMVNCHAFNQPIVIPDSVTTIGHNFMLNCHTFNQPIVIPDGVTSLNIDFLRACHAFNQPLVIPNGVTNIDNGFLNNCDIFNQYLVIPNSVTTIGQGFLMNCHAFNQPLVIPDGVTDIPASFLSGCRAFNQPLVIPDSVTTIGGHFMSSCRLFNQPLVIPDGVESIGFLFLMACYAFNQPLVIPNSLTGTPTSFLGNCYSFNQPLVIPDTLTSIGSSFMINCHAFNQPLVIPNTVTSISLGFMNNCRSFTTLTYNSNAFPTDNTSLGQISLNTRTSENGTGIIVYGTQRAGLMAALPDRTESPFRKLVDGGSD